MNTSFFFQDDNEINNDKEIAEAFNKYFVTIGSSLSSKLPLSSTSFDSFLRNKCPNSLFFTPIAKEEVVDYLNNIPSGKAPGFDALSSLVINKHAIL